MSTACSTYDLSCRADKVDLGDKVIELKVKLHADLKGLREDQYELVKKKKEQHTTEVRNFSQELSPDLLSMGQLGHYIIQKNNKSLRNFMILHGTM